MSALTDTTWWRGRRVWITGHTGFKGGWLALALAQAGARVWGFALPPDTSPNLFALADVGGSVASQLGDIRDRAAVQAAARVAEPEIVFHMAAQPLVRAAHADPVGTWATNVMGTVHVLDALAELKCARAVVVVTTDKVYDNREWAWAYRETDRLGGREAYGASKAATELVAASYRDRLASQGTAMMTVRAGNVIGGGDWSADRLIPDAVRAWSAGQPLVVRNPLAVRPWQHVLDCLTGYGLLARALADGNAPPATPALNFGPDGRDARRVQDVINLMQAAWPGHAGWQQDSASHPYEARLLEVDSSLARTTLGWQPRWGVDTAIARTAHWYRTVLSGSDARAATHADLEAHACA
jgi:CDP-glucose 4,6-dehydratase